MTVRNYKLTYAIFTIIIIMFSKHFICAFTGNC